ncbi:MAG: hypothetical protein AAEI08_04300 [Gammaproteobacteria bacterium]
MKIVLVMAVLLVSVFLIGRVLAQPGNPLNFADIDTNKDGVLTVDELGELAAVRDRGIGADRLLGFWDSDGNGSVTEEEFAARPRIGGMGGRGAMGMGGRGAMGMGR